MNAEERAAEEFSTLSDYERIELFRWGTAFTTWEDHGERFCEELNRLAERWAKEQVQD